MSLRSFQKIMYTISNIAENKAMKMKTSTKILLALYVAIMIPSVFLGKYVLSSFKVVDGGFGYDFNAYSISGIILQVAGMVVGTILFFRFLKTLTLPNMIFFSTIPYTILYGVGMYLLSHLALYSTPMARNVRLLLNITPENEYNSILWAVILTIVYILILLFTYFFVCRPVGKMEKVITRLSDGRVREEDIEIGGGKQFKTIEHSINKINDKYREKDNLIKQTKLETQKFIPKQFFKFLGKSNITELELGNKVKKRATTLLCDLRSASAHGQTLSLEENFNFINSYLNVASPIIRKFGGFVDKYMGDGLLAVFAKPENAIDCAHAIIRNIEVKNRSLKSMPAVSPKISIHTGEVVFGIVGEEERKSPTIISDVITLAERIEEINDFLNTKLIFSKAVLDVLPTKYKLSYRYLGSLTLEEKTDLPLFESLDVYSREKRERLKGLKSTFENGVRLYNKGEYKDAKSHFEEVLKSVSSDAAAYVYFNKASEKYSRRNA